MPQQSELRLSFAALQNRLVITGELVALTALRIGAGRAADYGDTDLPVLRDAIGRPFVPGASLKGALRARVEALIRAVAPDQALDFQEIEAWQERVIAPLKEEDSLRQNDRALSAAIWRNSSLIDLTFGAPWVAGRLFLKDAQVDQKLWFGQHEIRNGVALNRDTETAEEGLLYNYEVTPAGTRFDFELANAEPWQLGLVLLALKPWERGEVALGGFRSRGLGRVKLETAARRYSEIDGVDAVIDLLSHGPAEAGREVSDDDEQQWVSAFKQQLRGLPA
jgi:CRISPR-associated RAMP protein (TIGR02581 family)